MKIVIDATNIKAGGGLTHLKNIIENHEPDQNQKVEIIGGNWLNSIAVRPWLDKNTFDYEFSSFARQEFFKAFKLDKLLDKSNIAFIPGGTFSSKKIKYVSMSQNMLIFENEERNRFPKSFNWLRYHLLEYLQLRSFHNAKGIIYISNYAKNYIENKYPELKSKPSKVIYHGISDDFRQMPKTQKPIKDYSKKNPLKILYVSIINFYKHPWNVINAVKRLHNEGFNIELDLVGPMYKPSRSKFENALNGTKNFVFYRGKVSYGEISEAYKDADLFLFASTCENMPNILVEAMSAGLPILSSNYGPMPEILKDGGVYMDPVKEESIYMELKKLILNKEKRQQIAEKAYQYSLKFSWEKTSQQTFDFLQKFALEK